MPTPLSIFEGIVLPTLLVAIGIVVAQRPWKRAANADPRWIAAPLLCLAFEIAYLVFHPDRPSFPPGTGDIYFWVFYAAIGIGFLGFLDGVFRPPLWLRAVTLLMLWRLLVRTMLSRQIPDQITQNAAEFWIDVAGLILLIWFLSLELISRSVVGSAVPLVLAILACGSAVTLFTWHLIASSSLAIALAAFCFAIAVLSRWCRVNHANGASFAVVLLLQLLFIHGYFYSPDTFIPTDNLRTAILMASPLLIFAGDLPGIRQARPHWRLAARVLPLLLIVAIVAGLNVRSYAEAEKRSHATELEQ
ncbi:MAG: hypothetical protein M3O30_00110 [Planctomycetota bacterium]|nr:hypothetical protein [Planctomycetota bacterium]